MKALTIYGILATGDALSIATEESIDNYLY
jgi:hypothetical protein